MKPIVARKYRTFWIATRLGCIATGATAEEAIEKCRLYFAPLWVVGVEARHIGAIPALIYARIHGAYE